MARARVAVELASLVTPPPTLPRRGWIDLVNPTADEIRKVELEYRLELPSREELSEVELSSRVSEKNGVLYLNMPAVSRGASPDEPSSPLGFVLSKDVLVTVRYAALRAFDSVAQKISSDKLPHSAVETFLVVVDEMVDLSADLLEETARELDGISSVIFSNRPERSRREPWACGRVNALRTTTAVRLFLPVSE